MTDPNAADETLLEKSREAIDEAREAVKKVAESEDIEVGDLPAFADSTPGVDTANAFAEGGQAADADDGDDAPGSEIDDDVDPADGDPVDEDAEK